MMAGDAATTASSLEELAGHDLAFDAIECGGDPAPFLGKHGRVAGWLDRIHPTGKTLLRCAVDAGRSDAITAVVAAGASPLASDQFGVTPLHAACRRGDLGSVQALLGALPAGSVAGALLARDQEGSTALHSAAASGSVGVVAHLLRASADASAADAIGSTPLHAAAEGGHAGAVEVLAAAGADVNASNSVGNTPLHRAARHGLASAVEALCVQGADPTRTNSDGLTPLDLARVAAKAEKLPLGDIPPP